MHMLRFPFITGTDVPQGHNVSECNQTKLNLHLKMKLQFHTLMCIKVQAKMVATLCSDIIFIFLIFQTEEESILDIWHNLR